MASVFEYSDYRQYLRDYYDAMKARNAALSYRYLSQKAGINSSAFFPQVIEGARNLTKQSLLKVCKALDLQGPEAEFFENLVFFNQARTVEEKNLFFDRLVAVQSKARDVQVPPDRFDYFSQWWHPVVREVATMRPWGNDWEGIAAMLHPAITAEQARESVELLVELGFLRRKARSYVQADPVLKAGSAFHDHRIVRYQIQMLKLASEAFDRTRGADRSTAATVLGISRETFDLFVKKSRQFRSQLQEMSRVDDQADRVYLLTMSLVPLSQPLPKTP